MRTNANSSSSHRPADGSGVQHNIGGSSTTTTTTHQEQQPHTTIFVKREANEEDIVVEEEDDERKPPFIAQLSSSVSSQLPPPKRHSPRFANSNRTTTTNTTTSTTTITTTTSNENRRRHSIIPSAIFPQNAPHIEEQYVISIMICCNDNDDDINHNNNNIASSNAHYRWCIHERGTYLPIKIWRTKLFALPEIEQYENLARLDHENGTETLKHPDLLSQYFPDEVILLLLTGKNDDDEEDMKNNRTYTCFQNTSKIPGTNTTATTTTTSDILTGSPLPPGSKKRRKTMKSKSSSLSLFVPKPWNPMLIQQLTSYDLYRYRSHYFHIPILSIYCIFPRVTNHIPTRELCDIAERGLHCVFHNILPCRLYRINNCIQKFSTLPMIDQNGNSHNSDHHHHHVTTTRRSNYDYTNDTTNENNERHTAPMKSFWNLNELAIQSIFNNESRTAWTPPVTIWTADDTNTQRRYHHPSSPQQQQQQRKHHFLFLNGGNSKTTCTSYTVQLDDDHNDTPNTSDHKNVTITSTSKCQYISLMQQFLDLHESTGALPLIAKDVIKELITPGPRQKHVRSLQRTTMGIPFFVTDNTKSAMIGTVLRSYIRTLHHTIKTWVYSIWDDATAAAAATATGFNNHNRAGTFPTKSGNSTIVGTNLRESQPADVIVACCITGVEFEMILQLLQLSPQHLSDHFDLLTDPDMTWTSPNTRKINLSNFTPSTQPSYIYHSTVLGLPQQYITVRRLKSNTNQQPRNDNENETSRSDTDGVRYNDLQDAGVAFVSDDEADETIHNKEEQEQYEYITVALYKQKHIFLYGLQHLLYRYSKMRNHALLLKADHVDKKDANENSEANKNEGYHQNNESCEISTATPSTIEYIRQRLYGCRVAKYFGDEIYIGYVASIEKNDDNNEDTNHDEDTSPKHSLLSDLFNIQYDDGDEEDMNIHELYEQLQLYLDEMNDHDINVEEHGTLKAQISNARYIQTQLKVVLFPAVSKVIEIETLNNNDEDNNKNDDDDNKNNNNNNNDMNTESGSAIPVDPQSTIVDKGNHYHYHHHPDENSQNDVVDDINIQEIVDEGIDQAVQEMTRNGDMIHHEEK